MLAKPVVRDAYGKQDDLLPMRALPPRPRMPDKHTGDLGLSTTWWVEQGPIARPGEPERRPLVPHQVLVVAVGLTIVWGIAGGFLASVVLYRALDRANLSDVAGLQLPAPTRAIRR